MKVAGFLFVGLAAAVASAEELKVNVYEGPTECDEGDTVTVGDKLVMHYTGSIDESSSTGEPGSQFDSTRGPERDAFHVTIGYGEVIQGWDEGLVGLCAGSKAILTIPSEMGYGAHGAGCGRDGVCVIPGDATLKFDVEVVSVSKPIPPPNLFDKLDVDKDGMLTPDEILQHFKQNEEEPDAKIPPELMEKEDANKDGLVSREEFGGPSMPWDMCMEMLHLNQEPNTLGLAVRWLCERKQPVQHTPTGTDEL